MIPEPLIIVALILTALTVTPTVGLLLLYLIDRQNPSVTDDTINSHQVKN